MTSPLIGRLDSRNPRHPNPNLKAQLILMRAAAASKAVKANRHETRHHVHASRAPICLNLKEICRPAQVAPGRRFDLQETPNYLKVEMTV
jgi:hypothetical protein